MFHPTKNISLSTYFKFPNFLNHRYKRRNAHKPQNSQLNAVKFHQKGLNSGTAIGVLATGGGRRENMNTDNVNRNVSLDRNDTYTPMGVKGIADLDKSRAGQGTCGHICKKTWVNYEGKWESYRGPCTRIAGHLGKHDPLYYKRIIPRTDIVDEGDSPHIHLRPQNDPYELVKETLTSYDFLHGGL